MSPAKGCCLCGAVRFRAHLPTKWVAHCHCTQCRRAHGAAFVSWAGFRAEQVEIDGGPLRWYASSPPAERGFCAQCGSSLFFRSQRWPGELHIVLANFTDPIDRAPQSHVFWATHVDWVELGDALPRKG